MKHAASRRSTFDETEAASLSPASDHAGLMLTDAQFELFRNLSARYTGIVVAGFKRSMIYRRIKRRMNALSIRTVDDYCALLSGPDGRDELQPLINALTTNKTEFFREKHHFDHLTSVALPLLLSKRAALAQRRLRVWSAGCSTGEEPYSIALSLAQTIETHPDWDIKILATDIDTDVLDRGRKGLYRASDLRAIPRAYQVRGLETNKTRDGQFQIAAPLRKSVTFKQLNLHHAWPMQGPFDVIFCRNVVIYFGKDSQKAIFDRFADILTREGFLYCGHSESLYGICPRFRAAGQSIYQRLS